MGMVCSSAQSEAKIISTHDFLNIKVDLQVTHKAAMLKGLEGKGTILDTCGLSICKELCHCSGLFLT